MLKQDQYSPFSVEDQIVSIYLCGEGHYDSVPVDDVRNFETQLLSHLHHNATGVYDSIAGGKVLSDDQAEALIAETNKFKNGYLTHDGRRVVNEAEAEAMDASERGQERVQVKRGS